MKILAIDFGNKRIGLAISQNKTISGLETIKYDSLERALAVLAEIIRREEPKTIVVGMPVGNQTSEDQIRMFASKLNKLIEVPIKFADETLTSKEAERTLNQSNLKPRSEKYKQEVDRLCAKLILEQYLNSIK